MKMVRYRDQPKTCFKCGETDHEQRDCPAENSYAKTVAEPTPDKKKKEQRRQEAEITFSSPPGNKRKEISSPDRTRPIGNTWET